MNDKSIVAAQHSFVTDMETTMEIKTIALGKVNCYLLKHDTGFILIDTGPSNQRTELEVALGNAGCQPGNLNLIIATHGDSDHVGNCAYLRQKYKTKIALHQAEVEAVESGDPTRNKKFPDTLAWRLFKIILLFLKLNQADRFKPDLLLDDGHDLSSFGIDALILHVPGHSNGSVGVLTPGRDSATGAGQAFFCGDLLANFRNPAPGLGIFDLPEFETSIEKLNQCNIFMVYPGHGKPFAWEQFMKNYRKKVD
jgi:hydroxyacylglutathione hydrolase